MSYQPGPVEQRVAKRLGMSVGAVMAFLDVYTEEWLAFEREKKPADLDAVPEPVLLPADDKPTPRKRSKPAAKAAESPQDEPEEVRV